MVPNFSKSAFAIDVNAQGLILQMFLMFLIHWKFQNFWKKTFQGVSDNKEPLIFWKYPQEFTDWTIAGCFYLKPLSEIIFKTRKVYKVT